MYVVVLFDYDDVAVNNVFGPFPSEDEAEGYAEMMIRSNTNPDRTYLAYPVETLKGN